MGIQTELCPIFCDRLEIVNPFSEKNKLRNPVPPCFCSETGFLQNFQFKIVYTQAIASEATSITFRPTDAATGRKFATN